MPSKLMLYKKAIISKRAWNAGHFEAGISALASQK